MVTIKRRFWGWSGGMVGVGTILAVCGQVGAEHHRVPQSTSRNTAKSSASTKVATDADIRRMVREIDAGHIETTIRTLVGFGTRNTLSAQDDPKRGIGAARDWIAGEFRKIAAAPETEGRLTVALQSFTQPVAPVCPNRPC